MNSTSAMLRGALGFGLVSMIGFSAWALGGAWFHRLGAMGEVALYLACALAFLLSAGWIFRPLLPGAGSVAAFYREFLPAFLCYAVLWSVVYLLRPSYQAEWWASLAGCAAYAAVTAHYRQSWGRFALAVTALFALHCAGYFAGRHLYYSMAPGLWPKLLWGLCYGLGFGAGIGWLYAALPRR